MSDWIGTKILRVSDHSVPLMSGYSMRNLAILEAQHRMGSPMHYIAGPIYAFAFHRTLANALARWPGLDAVGGGGPCLWPWCLLSSRRDLLFANTSFCACLSLIRRSVARNAAGHCRQNELERRTI